MSSQSAPDVHKEILKKLREIELNEKQQRQELRKKIGTEMTRRAQSKLNAAKAVMADANLAFDERLARMYQSLLDEVKLNRALDTDLEVAKRTNADLEQRNSHLLDQVTKLTQQKNSMQQLCDALHKQNKEIDSLHKQMRTEEEKARETIREQLESKVNNIADSLKNDYKERMEAIIAENEALKKDREIMLDRLEKMDALHNALEEKTSMERKLSETQLQKQNDQHKIFTEKLIELKEKLLGELTKAQSERDIFAARAKEYADRFADMEKHVSGHTKLVEQYKNLVSMVQKTNEKLKKENGTLLRKDKTSREQLSNMQAVAQKAVDLQKENDTLKKMCNVLQERLKSSTTKSAIPEDQDVQIDQSSSTLVSAQPPASTVLEESTEL